ncbi:MAG: hypothetical protein JW841_02650 [Deltaproteobacteria bacterium]|nr:hypothetical protein [Deltaproteobacteria bacterium]
MSRCQRHGDVLGPQAKIANRYAQGFVMQQVQRSSMEYGDFGVNTKQNIPLNRIHAHEFINTIDPHEQRMLICRAPSMSYRRLRAHTIGAEHPTQCFNDMGSRLLSNLSDKWAGHWVAPLPEKSKAYNPQLPRFGLFGSCGSRVNATPCLTRQA